MSKSVISYCGKFDLLYAVTVKAVGLEAEMEMRQKIGEVVDRRKWFMDSLKVDPKIMMGGFPRFRNLGGAVPTTRNRTHSKI